MARAVAQAENLYGAVHLGTGTEVSPFCIDWQDSDATIRWMEMVLDECPQGERVLWLDGASHHTSDARCRVVGGKPAVAGDQLPGLHA